jgi:WD40 repeat protein
MRKPLELVVLIVSLTTGRLLVLADGTNSTDADQRFIRRELGDIDNVYALVFSPDCRFLLAGGDRSRENGEKIACLWDVAAMTQIRKIDSGSIFQLSQLAFSPNGKAIAMGTINGEVKVSAVDGKQIKSFRHFENQATFIKHLYFVDDNNVSSSCFFGLSQTWNIKDNRCLTYHLSSNPLGGVSTNRSGQLCCYTDSDSAVVLSDNCSKFVCRVAIPSDYTTNGIAIADNGRQLMTIGNKGNSSLVDLMTKTIIKKWRGHNSTIYVVIAIPGNRGYISGDRDGRIRIWDSDGTLVSDVCRYQSAVTTFAVSPDATLLATGGEKQRIVLWDLKALMKAK